MRAVALVARPWAADALGAEIWRACNDSGLEVELHPLLGAEPSGGAGGLTITARHQRLVGQDQGAAHARVFDVQAVKVYSTTKGWIYKVTRQMKNLQKLSHEGVGTILGHAQSFVGCLEGEGVDEGCDGLRFEASFSLDSCVFDGYGGREGSAAPRGAVGLAGLALLAKLAAMFQPEGLPETVRGLFCALDEGRKPCIRVAEVSVGRWAGAVKEMSRIVGDLRKGSTGGSRWAPRGLGYRCLEVLLSDMGVVWRGRDCMQVDLRNPLSWHEAAKREAAIASESALVLEMQRVEDEGRAEEESAAQEVPELDWEELMQGISGEGGFSTVAEGGDEFRRWVVRVADEMRSMFAVEETCVGVARAWMEGQAATVVCKWREKQRAWDEWVAAREEAGGEEMECEDGPFWRKLSWEVATVLAVMTAGQRVGMLEVLFNVLKEGCWAVEGSPGRQVLLFKDSTGRLLSRGSQLTVWGVHVLALKTCNVMIGAMEAARQRRERETE